MVPCICVNDLNKPWSIPSEKWVKRDEEYHITLVTFHPMQQGGIQGCSLYEKPLDQSCYPFEYFKLSRFAFTRENLDKLIELIKQSSELDDVQIDRFIKEEELQIVE